MSKLEHDGLTIQQLFTQDELDAYVQVGDNCFIDTADNDATRVLARNTGTEQDIETIFEKLAKLTTVPIASGKSRDPVVFMLDSLSALEDMKCPKKRIENYADDE